MMNAPNQEIALAAELLEITSEAELNRILPRLIGPALAGLRAVAPLVAQAAAPVLKKAAARAIPRMKSTVARRSTDAGSDRRVVDDFGFGPSVGTRDARLWGTGFQRSRPRDIQVAMSLRFVQAARRAARRAAIATLRQIRRGGPVSYDGLRRVVFRALLGAVRERAPFLLPTMGAVASSLRQAPGFTGRALPRPRPGRLLGAPEASSARQMGGYTGRTLPSPRSRILGTPRTGGKCHTCARAQASEAETFANEVGELGGWWCKLKCSWDHETCKGVCAPWDYDCITQCARDMQDCLKKC